MLRAAAACLRAPPAPLMAATCACRFVQSDKRTYEEFLRQVLTRSQADMQDTDQYMIRQTCQSDEAVDAARSTFDAARRSLLLCNEQQLLQVRGTLAVPALQGGRGVSSGRSP